MSQANNSYFLEEVTIESERISEPIDIKQTVTDVEIFEHLNKPYLDAKVLVVDSNRILEGLDLIGGEQITITIVGNFEGAQSITNKFRITKIEPKKGKDAAQAVVFTLTQEEAFLSKLQNVNRYYDGKISEIVQKIADEFLELNVNADNNDKKDVNVVIPNYHPLDAIKWLTRSATTVDGYPYYCFANAFDPDLTFVDLGTMFKAQPINEVPYTNISASVTSFPDETKRKTIISHEFIQGKSVSEMIDDGFVGAQYEILNTADEKDVITWDLVFDLYNDLVQDEVLPQNQQSFPYSDKYKMLGKSFNQFTSSHVHKFGGSYAYRLNDDPEFDLGLNEQHTDAEYRLDIVNDTMRKLMNVAPLVMVVDGQDFLAGGKSPCLGNNVSVNFSKSSPETEVGETLDLNKSGDYLIYAARHMFKRERYDVSLLCTKIGRQ